MLMFSPEFSDGALNREAAGSSIGKFDCVLAVAQFEFEHYSREPDAQLNP